MMILRILGNRIQKNIVYGTHRMVMFKEGVHPLHLFGSKGLQNEKPVVALVELRARLS